MRIGEFVETGEGGGEVQQQQQQQGRQLQQQQQLFEDVSEGRQQAQPVMITGVYTVYIIMHSTVHYSEHQKKDL